MMESEEINVLIDHPNEPVTFDFMDDGHTGYAYLHGKDGVVADVWLYNRDDTPQVPDWSERGKMPMPYRNAERFTKSERMFDLPVSEDDIDVNWVKKATGEVGAEVLLRGCPIGELFVGDKPGRSVMALKDGPLARVMASR